MTLKDWVVLGETAISDFPAATNIPLKVASC